MSEEMEVEFQFEYESGYRVVPSNGVWGGVTPRGEFKIDFFVESQVMPSRMKQKIVDGTLGDEISRVPDKDAKVITRRLQVGVLMSIRDAMNLQKIIKEKLGELDERKGEK